MMQRSRRKGSLGKTVGARRRWRCGSCGECSAGSLGLGVWAARPDGREEETYVLQVRHGVRQIAGKWTSAGLELTLSTSLDLAHHAAIFSARTARAGHHWRTVCQPGTLQPSGIHRLEPYRQSHDSP